MKKKSQMVRATNLYMFNRPLLQLKYQNLSFTSILLQMCALTRLSNEFTLITVLICVLSQNWLLMQLDAIQMV